MERHEDFTIDVSYYRLADTVQPYFTALYRFEIKCPPGELIEDHLHPEWAAMRFTATGPPPVASVGPGSLEPQWPFVVSGPTSKSIRFGLQHSKIWGLGLQPAGFARYVPTSARNFTDRTFNGRTAPQFSAFAPILQIVNAGCDDDETACRIDAHLQSLPACPVPHLDKVHACQDALKEGTISTVSDLCDKLGISRRSLERLCARHFGFPPKMLLRRQRFLRSLAQFTLAAKGSWSKALDGQYYDQAHFVRDFRAFMDITPTEYAEAPHPILDRIMAQRMADQGAAPPTDLPTVLRYGAMIEQSHAKAR